MESLFIRSFLFRYSSSGLSPVRVPITSYPVSLSPYHYFRLLMDRLLVQATGTVFNEESAIYLINSSTALAAISDDAGFWPVIRLPSVIA